MGDIFPENTSNGSVLDDMWSSRIPAMSEDPVCVVSMACRLPGDIRSPSDLWNFLLDKKSAHGQISSDRFNVEGFYSMSEKKAGTMNLDGAYLLNEDVRQFENSVFGINNLEATYMDPQQRKLLEITYEALESAGISMERISGSNTGVYIANFTHDYFLMQMRDPDTLHRYHGTGSGTTLLANRISHVFNLHGPSFTLDTACSSSIHCLHTAVSALKNGECEGAIVAASNLILTPEPFVAAMKTGVLSSSSTCQTFDADANGYGRAEGVNAVYLKTLSNALRDGDDICAIIRGTAINSNGRTPGITLPSAEFQEAVIRKAYSTAGVEFSGTDYVECHGTGTAVGDPIELEALGNCFSNPYRDHPLLIGSVKSNLGHSEAASGLTSLIKVVLALQHGTIPPMRKPATLNPRLALEQRHMRIVDDLEPWPRQLVRRASLNSFGYGGANAHAILESFETFMASQEVALPREIPIPEPQATSMNPSSPKVLALPVSAMSPASLQQRIEQTVALVNRCDASTLGNLAFTLCSRRPHLSVKACLLVGPGHEPDTARVEIIDTPVDIQQDPLPLAFVFTGQGAQYAEMAKELLHSSAVFSASICEQDAVLKALPAIHAPTWTLEQTMMDSSDLSEINDPIRSQPTCTAVQIALVQVMSSWGIEPSAVIGHSSGEIAAAYAAGLLSMSEAIIVSYLRGHAVSHVRAQGGMMATGLSLHDANRLIEEMSLTGEIQVACVNAPENVTLSGSLEGLDRISLELQARNKFCRRLLTGGRAYHSHMMKEAGVIYQDLLERYVKVTSRPNLKSTRVTMYSTVGCRENASPVIDDLSSMPEYWRSNLESTVQFTRALESLASTRKFHLVEVGPHSALRGPIHQTLASNPFPYTPSLVRNVNSQLSTAKLAATLYTHGHQISWKQVNDLPLSAQISMHDLPPYPWDYSGGLLWFEPRFAIDVRNRPYPRHEMLGSQELGGSDVDWKWRNVLHLEEIPWIRDHKVENQVVFPAAGYLAMAMEAFSQILGHNEPRDSLSFKFQNVSFIAALVLTEDQVDTELHTIMSRRRISTKTSSSVFYDFCISSWKAKNAVVHCEGSICALHETSAFGGTVLVNDDLAYRDWPMAPWYGKAKEEGLCFGPSLQSITTLRADSTRVRTDSVCTTFLTAANDETLSTMDAAHPIAIDACLQAAILSAACGSVSKFCPYLPVFVESCHVSPISSLDQDRDKAFIHVRSQKTGVSSLRSDSTLRDSQGRPILDFQGVRLARYNGKLDRKQNNSDISSKREPIMRVRWRPDVFHLHSGIQEGFDKCTESLVRRSQTHSIMDTTQEDRNLITTVGTMLELLGHKNPRMHVLHLLDNDEMADSTQIWRDLLDQGTSFPRYRTWTARKLTVYGILDADDLAAEEKSDIVLHVGTKSDRAWEGPSPWFLSEAVPGGFIITRTSELSRARLEAAGYNILLNQQGITLAKSTMSAVSLLGKDVLILISSQASQNVLELARTLTTRLLISNVRQVNTLKFEELSSTTLHADTVCISLMELERELLASLDSQAMNLLRMVTGKVRDLLWITGADMLSAHPNADLTLAPGLARSLMMEQPSLRFVVLDIGQPASQNHDMDLTCENIQRLLTEPRDIDDKEYIQSNGILHVSRLGPDFDVNALFRRRLRMEDPVSKLPVAQALPARVTIDRPGSADTIFFEHLHEPSSELPLGFIDVAVKAVSLNAKDVYAIHGIIETRTGTIALEFTGIVTNVASDVQHISPGDPVLVCVPNNFATTQRVPVWQAHKLKPDEDLREMSTLLVTNGAALYALRDRASLRRGESVLIHSGAGAFGIAAITMAQRMGAVVYATVGSPNRRAYLVEHLGLDPDHIFSSRDESFVEGVMAKTDGRGVDVVINSLVGDLMHASWSCVAQFGRFLEIGKRELLDAGKLQMDVFARSASFIAFDITEMLYHQDEYYQRLYTSLAKDVIAMYRSGDITLAPITTFDAAEIANAYRYFSSRDRIGKVVITFGNDKSLIPVAPAKHFATFEHNKSYLLVGCLGGLGRSLSNWMRTRGARNFVFLGRSGCDKPQAADLVQSLERSGARVIVVRGDVANTDDVTSAVKASQSLGPVGGVVHAAMGLHEDLFSLMSNEGWQTSVRPKWAGAWNLHNALQEEDPDFFLLTSSMTGTVGVATETNYCAANAFLDAFAYWRRSQGKPAVSIGLGMISEVGYLHENPQIESLLLRRGIQPLNEDEFLQLADLAITGGCGESDEITSAASLMLTGMETAGVRELLARGYEVTHTVMDDQRSAILSAALESGQHGSQSALDGMHLDSVTSQWLKGVRKDAAAALTTEATATSLREAIEGVIGRKFSNLVLIPLDKIEYGKSFAEFGVDSMIASEFRTWFWNVFKVDVPFLDLLSSESSLSAVALRVETGIVDVTGMP